MGNIWQVRVPVTEHGEIVDEFLARDFDPAEIWDEWGFHPYVDIVDKTNRGDLVCRIEPRRDRALVADMEEDGLL